ncbi:MAG TPA: hypothetical protein VGD37_36215 [Kofleriaceae bacterium]|jgi:hypothetical protein
MKKITNRTVQLHKLVLRRETITTLTLTELRDVAAAGNGGSFWPCQILSFDNPCDQIKG